MRILCVGASGQVARSLAERSAQNGTELIALGRPVLNMLDPNSIVSNIETQRPDIIINAAAYTAVDLAETERDAAFSLNAQAPGVLADVAETFDVPIIHFSTDYVFDGSNEDPYSETMSVNPTGYYGETKLLGERSVAKNARKHIILRTAWVYGPFGKNFVKTMLRLASDREEVSVVSDQVGNPTNSIDIADATLKICSMVFDQSAKNPWGTFHLAGTGATNWASLAKEIFAISDRAGGPYAQVNELTTEEYPTPAKRPANSQLDCVKLSRTFGIELPFWQESLKPTIERILSEQKGTS